MKFWLLIFLLLPNAWAGQPDGVIYSARDLPDSLKAATAAVAMVCSAGGLTLTADGKNWDLHLELSLPGCSETNYEGEVGPNACTCSAFLVKPNVVATAAHCLLEKNPCDDLRFIFNVTAQKGLAPVDEVFGCKKILSKTSGATDSYHDFALIELDRAVESAIPLNYSRNQPTPMGARSVILGHPGGLPMKASSGEVMFVDPLSGGLAISAASSAGMSGSPIVSESGELLGIASTSRKCSYELRRGRKPHTPAEQCERPADFSNQDLIYMMGSDGVLCGTGVTPVYNFIDKLEEIF